MANISPARALAASLLLAACTPPSSATGDDAPPGDAAGSPDRDGNEACLVPADPFEPAVLESGIRFLSSDELGGRGPNTPGDRTTREYIESAFRCIGLVPGGADGSYQQPFVAPDGT